MIRRVVALGPPTKLVAAMLAQYGNPDGTRVRPGTRRLVAVTGLSERRVRGSLTELRDLDLLDRRVAGGTKGVHRGWTDEYRLTIPIEVASLGELLPPSEVEDEPPAPGAGGQPVDDRGNHRQEVPVVQDDHRHLLPRPPAGGAATTGTSCTPPESSPPTRPPTERTSPKQTRADGWRASKRSSALAAARAVIDRDPLGAKAERFARDECGPMADELKILREAGRALADLEWRAEQFSEWSA